MLSITVKADLTCPDKFYVEVTKLAATGLTEIEDYIVEAGNR